MQVSPSYDAYRSGTILKKDEDPLLSERILAAVSALLHEEVDQPPEETIGI